MVSAQEAGIQFKIPILALPLRFWGGRIGVRNNSFNSMMRNTSLIFEFGGGSW